MRRLTTHHLQGLAVVAATVLPFASMGLTMGVANDGFPLPTTPPSAASDRSIGEAVEAWDFSGFHGSFAFEREGAHWASIAFPVNTSAEFDVEIRLRWTRPQPHGPRDDTQFWLCFYEGPKAYGDTELTKVSGCYRSSNFNGDGVWEVTVELDGDQHQLEVPLYGLCSIDNVCFVDDDRTLTIKIDESRYADSWVLPEPNPIVHILYASGGRPPAKLSMEVDWDNTVVAHAIGGKEDYFTYLREDFRSDLFVHADVTGAVKPYHQEGARLNLAMGHEDRPTWLWFAPYSKGDTPVTDGDWEHGFVRPDGTAWTSDHDHVEAEVTNMEGTWSFWYDGSSRLNPNDHAGGNYDPWAEDPVLVGTEFDWARLPWET